MGKLDGKVALITGATKGIGEAAARLFAAEGAKVVLCGRSEQDGKRVETEINETCPGSAAFFRLDVADYENWQQAVGFAEETFGKLNILINNAGISFRETLAETTPESWDRTVATNQTGVYYGMKICIAAMAENGEPGAVVSTASVDGVTGDEDFFSYCATKAAVQAMTRCAALYCGHRGLPIRVNAVTPRVYSHAYGGRGCPAERPDHRGILPGFHCLASHWAAGHGGGSCEGLPVSCLRRFLFCYRYHADGGRRLYRAVTSFLTKKKQG